MDSDLRSQRSGLRGFSIHRLIPNVLTLAALCSGLTGIRFAITAASGGALASHPYAFSNALPLDDWQKSVLAVMLATPKDLEDFALGFSLTEGMIASKGDIKSLEVLAVEGGMEAQFRAAVVGTIAGGSSEIQRDIIAKTLGL